MTTTRERALEAALGSILDKIDAASGSPSFTAAEHDNYLAILGSVRAPDDRVPVLSKGRAVRLDALPPSQPEIDEELLGHTKTALAEHAKLYAINADMLAALRDAECELFYASTGSINPEAVRDALAKVRAAMIKATGEK